MHRDVGIALPFLYISHCLLNDVHWSGELLALNEGVSVLGRSHDLLVMGGDAPSAHGG